MIREAMQFLTGLKEEAMEPSRRIKYYDQRSNAVFNRIEGRSNGAEQEDKIL